MGITRRSFLGRAVAVLAGATFAGAGWAYLKGLARGADRDTRQTASSPSATAQQGVEHAHRWAFVVDTLKCIGCGRCVAACKVENNVPQDPHFNRTWVERYVIDDHGAAYVDSPEAGIRGFDSWPINIKYQNIDVAKSFFVSKLCNQCENPPCVQVCPVGATYNSEDGVILVNRSRCIGCGYCLMACPYGARFLDPNERVADKCTWCYHRISKGMDPACVEVCPVGARMFGDPSDPDSKVAKALRENRIDVLKPNLGTRPQVFYIGLDQEVR